MSEITLKTRIQNKYKTLDEWNEILEGEFTPLKGEVFYATQENILYQKIGDGITDFTKLNWLELQHPQSDWEENDSNKNSYIKNKTHFQELITLTWDGNEEGYEVYEDTNQDTEGYIRYVRILDSVPWSKEDLSIPGSCKYSYGNEIYDSNNLEQWESGNYKDFSFQLYYQPGIFNTQLPEDDSFYNSYSAEAITIYFYTDIEGYTNDKVIFILQEGTTIPHASAQQPVNLPIGVYFVSTTKSYLDISPIKTLEYSFYATKRLSENFTNRALASYSKNITNSNNLIYASYSTAAGKDNFIGYYTPTATQIGGNKGWRDPEMSLNAYTTIKKCSHAEGAANKIFGNYCHAEGAGNVLACETSHIEGENNTAGDFTSTSSASGGNHIEGSGNKLSGLDSYGQHVEGRFSSVQGGYGAHAEGYRTIAQGEGAHSQNSETEARGKGASASGIGSKALAAGADAGGSSTQALHSDSFTRGWKTISGANYQTVIGTFNEVFDDSLFDVGNGNSVARKTAFSVKQDGSAKLQLQGTTEDSITRKDYVDKAIKNSVDEAVKNILNIAERVDSWETVQKIVRAGYAPFIFKVGDQFVCNHSEFGELTWDIIGFNHDVPTDSNYEYSMTLQLHDILDTTYREFDGREAIFCASEEINPGNYCISYNNKIDGSGTTSYLKFTIPAGVVVPVGGLFVNLASSGNTYTILQDCFSTDNPLGTFTTTSSSSVPDGYTLLGECNYYRAYNITSASSFYKESGIRFYLNGNSSNSIDWVPQHSCDMPPPYVNSSGFMYGLDEDFKNVLGKVRKKTYDAVSDSVFCTDDFIFLPSRSEVYGGDNISVSDCVVDEGLPYEYYINNSELEDCGTSKDSNRIKYGSDDVAYRYYLRSLSLTRSTSGINSNVLFRIGCVSDTGSITVITCRATGDAGKGYLVPCCCIV